MQLLPLVRGVQHVNHPGYFLDPEIIQQLTFPRNSLCPNTGLNRR